MKTETKEDIDQFEEKMDREFRRTKQAIFRAREVLDEMDNKIDVNHEETNQRFDELSKKIDAGFEKMVALIPKQ